MPRRPTPSKSLSKADLTAALRHLGGAMRAELRENTREILGHGAVGARWHATTLIRL